MRTDLLKTLNELQTLLAQVDDPRLPSILDLPQIVAVGSQSAGKSSVLESLIGCPILPRGSGMVTKCPIVIQMTKGSLETLHQSLRPDQSFRPDQSLRPDRSVRPERSTGSDWYAYFPEDGEQKIFTDGQAVADEIARRTSLNLANGETLFYESEMSTTGSTPLGGDVTVGVGLETSLQTRRETETRRSPIELEGGAARLSLTQLTKRSGPLNGQRENMETEKRTIAPVSSRPIVVRIVKPDSVQLTIVDLPGLVKLPTSEQPEDVEQQIFQIAWKYVATPKSIILAVSAANNDLATSEALNLARRVDPKGLRTVGVLTKVDLISDKSTIIDIVMGRVYPLAHGYILMNCKIDQAREQSWFSSHFPSRDVSAFCGSSNLVNKMSQLLMNHAERFLPSLKISVKENLNRLNLELKSFGDESLDGDSPGLLLDLFTRYTRIVEDLLQGRTCNSLNFFQTYSNRRELSASPQVSASPGLSASPQVSVSPDLSASVLLNTSSSNVYIHPTAEHHNGNHTNNGSSAIAIGPTKDSQVMHRNMLSSSEESELVGGARLHYIFHDWFSAKIMSISGLEGVRERDVRIAIRNASGSGACLFIPESAFESLVKRQIIKLEKLSLDCLDLSVTELRHILLSPFIVSQEFSKFLNLKKKINVIIERLMAVNSERTRHALQDLVQIQLAFINKSHPDFVKVTKNYLDKPIVSSAVSSTNQTLDLDPNSFLTFWRRHPLQQTPAAPVSLRARRKSPPPVTPRLLAESPPSNGTSSCQVEVDLVKTLMVSYFDIVKKSFADLVPKTIMHFLVNRTRESLHRELITDLYKPELYESLLQQDPKIAHKREMLKNSMILLDKVLQKLKAGLASCR